MCPVKSKGRQHRSPLGLPACVTGLPTGLTEGGQA
jgi:hypothetical protein